MNVNNPIRKAKVEWVHSTIKSLYTSKKKGKVDLYKMDGESDKYIVMGKIPPYLGVHIAENDSAGRFIGRPFSREDLGKVQTFNKGFFGLSFETRSTENLELEVWFYPKED